MGEYLGWCAAFDLFRDFAVTSTCGVTIASLETTKAQWHELRTTTICAGVYAQCMVGICLS